MVPPERPFPSGVRATDGPHGLVAARRPPDCVAAVRGSVVVGDLGQRKQARSSTSSPRKNRPSWPHGGQRLRCARVSRPTQKPGNDPFFLLPRGAGWAMMRLGAWATCTSSTVGVAAGRTPLRGLFV